MIQIYDTGKKHLQPIKTSKQGTQSLCDVVLEYWRFLGRCAARRCCGWRAAFQLCAWSICEQHSRDVWPFTCPDMYLPLFSMPHWEKGLGVEIKLIVHRGINPSKQAIRLTQHDNHACLMTSSPPGVCDSLCIQSVKRTQHKIWPPIWVKLFLVACEPFRFVLIV